MVIDSISGVGFISTVKEGVSIAIKASGDEEGSVFWSVYRFWLALYTNRKVFKNCVLSISLLTRSSSLNNTLYPPIFKSKSILIAFAISLALISSFD